MLVVCGTVPFCHCGTEVLSNIIPAGAESSDGRLLRRSECKRCDSGRKNKIMYRDMYCFCLFGGGRDKQGAQVERRVGLR